MTHLAGFWTRRPVSSGVVLILAAVLALSFVTLILSRDSSREFPFYSIAAFSSGRALSAGTCAWLLAGGRSGLLTAARRPAPALFWCFAGRMENLAFVFSIRWISPALSALMAECWPVFCMWLISRDPRSRRAGWAPLTPWGVAGALLALLSLALGAWSQWTGAVGVERVSWAGFLLGCGLAACIPLCFAFDSRVMAWSLDLARREFPGGGFRAGMVGLSFWFAAASLFAAVVGGAGGRLAGERWDDGMWLSLLVGLAAGVAGILWRLGYFVARRPELVGLMSFAPALSGLWLSLFGGLAADPWLMAPALALLGVSGLLVCWRPSGAVS